MMRPMRAAAVVALLVVAAPSGADAKDSIAYMVEVGAAVPLGAGLTDPPGTSLKPGGANAEPGFHIGAGVYWNAIAGLWVGGVGSYTSMFGIDGDARASSDIVGIKIKAMYLGQVMRLLEWYAEVGLGFYFAEVPGFQKEQQLGAEGGLGLNFIVWGPLSLGPSATITVPTFSKSRLYLTGSLRFHWGF